MLSLGDTMNKFSYFTSSNSERGSIRNALRSQEPERVKLFDTGGRLSVEGIRLNYDIPMLLTCVFDFSNFDY